MLANLQKRVKAEKRQPEKLAQVEAKVEDLEEVSSPVLTEEDEDFLERMVLDEGPPPPLPERPHALIPEAGDPVDNKAQLVVHDNPGTESGRSDGKHKDKGKENAHKEKKKSSRFSFLRKSRKKTSDGLKPDVNAPPEEAEKEEDDISRVLEELNLAAVNNRAFSISKESEVLVQKFTVVLKDLVNGVPTAYDDLVKLIEDSSGTLSKNYDNLPGFLKKLITQLPNKLTSTLAPELLVVAAEAQALAGGGNTSATSKASAKNLFSPSTLKNLVAKPGAIAGLLRTIINTLKLRWPAFMGTNVLLSLGLFVLLFVFWYCHKRGKEVRLEKERMADSNGRVTELEDDPMLPPPPQATGAQSRPVSSHAKQPEQK